MNNLRDTIIPKFTRNSPEIEDAIVVGEDFTGVQSVVKPEKPGQTLMLAHQAGVLIYRVSFTATKFVLVRVVPIVVSKLWILTVALVYLLLKVAEVSLGFFYSIVADANESLRNNQNKETQGDETFGNWKKDNCRKQGNGNININININQ